MVVCVFAGCDTPEESKADIGDNNNRFLLRKVKRNRIVNNKDSPQEAARYLGVNFYAKKGKQRFTTENKYGILLCKGR